MIKNIISVIFSLGFLLASIGASSEGLSPPSEEQMRPIAPCALFSCNTPPPPLAAAPVTPKPEWLGLKALPEKQMRQNTPCALGLCSSGPSPRSAAQPGVGIGMSAHALAEGRLMTVVNRETMAATDSGKPSGSVMGILPVNALGAEAYSPISEELIVDLLSFDHVTPNAMNAQGGRVLIGRMELGQSSLSMNQ